MRLLSEIYTRLTTGQLRAEAGDLLGAAAQLPEVEHLLHRGIACGALPDSWNILGFQGLYPLFTAMEDSVRDTRIDELLAVVEQTFHLYARLLAEAGPKGFAAAWLRHRGLAWAVDLLEPRPSRFPEISDLKLEPAE